MRENNSAIFNQYEVNCIENKMILQEYELQAFTVENTGSRTVH